VIIVLLWVRFFYCLHYVLLWFRRISYCWQTDFMKIELNAHPVVIYLYEVLLYNLCGLLTMNGVHSAS
jgi:hypothetical protein